MEAAPATHASDGCAAGARPHSYARITKPPNWHALVAWDILFNNLATGLFLVAAAGEFIAPQTFGPLTRWAYPVALVFLTVDLVCLVLDLGDPWRFHHMLRVFKPTSPMSLGTWCLSAFSFPLAVAALLGLLGSGGALNVIRIGAVVLAIVPAFGAAVYKGVLLSTNSQPGWRDARWMGAYLTSSAIYIGCAEMLVLAVFWGEAHAVDLLRRALITLLVLNLIPFALLVADMRQTLGVIYPAPRRWQVAGAILGGGTMLPLALLFTVSSALLLAAVICILTASFYIRLFIVHMPHEI